MSTVLRYLSLMDIIVLILDTYLLSVYLVVSHYDLQSMQMDHLSVVLVLSFVFGQQAIEHCKLCIQNVYFKCIFNITL